MSHDNDIPDVGPCCCCGTSDPKAMIRNFVLLHKRAPVPGTGWGCLQCGLPMDGAVAVVCDACLVDGRPDPDTLKSVIFGDPGDRMRMDIEALSAEEFDHDYSRHPEVQQERDQWN